MTLLLTLLKLTYKTNHSINLKKQIDKISCIMGYFSADASKVPKCKNMFKFDYTDTRPTSNNFVNS